MRTANTRMPKDPGLNETGALPTVLAQVGLIATPAGLIALFCQVLDVSAQSTAAMSLASVFLTSICVYRRFINRHFPSTILTALLVALATVFFFNYKNILLKDTGLIRYYKHSNDFLAVVDSEIENSREEVWFFGTNFNVTAGQRRDLLLRKLGQGVKVKFLIFNPRSPHLEDLARDFSQSPEELKAECDKGGFKVFWSSKRSGKSDPRRHRAQANST